MRSATYQAIRLIAVTALAIIALAATESAAAAAAPKLTASQASDLSAAGQTITVTGTGFAPGTALFLAVCDPAVPAGKACDLSNYKQVSTDAKGGFSAEIKVVAKFGTTDCTAASCAVTTNEPANPRSTANVAVLPITFAGATTGASPTPAPAATSAQPSDDPSPTVAGDSDTDSGSTWIIVGVIVVALLLALGAYLFRKRRRDRA